MPSTGAEIANAPPTNRAVKAAAVSGVKAMQTIRVASANAASSPMSAASAGVTMMGGAIA